jgi:hypothetical protein
MNIPNFLGFKMPAKLKGSEVRRNISIRLEPKQKEEIIKLFGSVQKWVDQCIAVLNKSRGVK